MGKVVLIVLLVVAAVFWLRHKALAQRTRRGTSPASGAARGQAGESSDSSSNAAGSASGAPNARSKAGGGADTLQGEDMVACVHCSVNVPQREAVQGASGRRYCGAEHRALAKDEVR